MGLRAQQSDRGRPAPPCHCERREAASIGQPRHVTGSATKQPRSGQPRHVIARTAKQPQSASPEMSLRAQRSSLGQPLAPRHRERSPATRVGRQRHVIASAAKQSRSAGGPLAPGWLRCARDDLGHGNQSSGRQHQRYVSLDAACPNLRSPPTPFDTKTAGQSQRPFRNHFEPAGKPALPLARGTSPTPGAKAYDHLFLIAQKFFVSI